MSPRIIQLPMSGRDRRHYVRELRAAEQAHRSLVAEVEAAFRSANHLACKEWNTLQFISGDAAPSPTIAQALDAGCELLEVRCKRCGHESIVDLAEAIWPRENQIHTLAKALRCQRCKDQRKKPEPDLLALRNAQPTGSGAAGECGAPGNVVMTSENRLHGEPVYSDVRGVMGVMAIAAMILTVIALAAAALILKSL